MTPATCKTCRFCDVQPERKVQAQGVTPSTCRKNPPVLLTVPVMGPGGQPTIAQLGGFPPVDVDNGWCGDWQPQPGRVES